VIMTVPLLVGLDGVQKMSKSLHNYVGINEAPKEIFGKIMSISDELMFTYYELVTDVPREEIAGYREGIGKGTIHPRDVKVKLAKNICAQFYDRETAERAAEEFTRVFSNKEVPDDVPEFRVPDGEKAGGSIWIVKLMVLAGTAATNGEARRLIKGGGVTFNNEKISAEDHELPLPAEGILKVGKRKFVKIIG
jgi:tyrosyl-tRNA synthetase